MMKALIESGTPIKDVAEKWGDFLHDDLSLFGKTVKKPSLRYPVNQCLSQGFNIIK
jgi:hypothetical protein